MQLQPTKKQFRSCVIEESVPLADKNWFGTGGHAQFLSRPATSQELQDAVQFANERELPILVLGKGANMLVSDEGVAGLVIQPNLQGIAFDGMQVTAGAGVCLDTLINACLDEGLLGLEEFSGIPGTVGGAVFINLHYFDFLFSQFLVRATVLDKHTSELIDVDREWFQFGYNQSTLHDENHILVSAMFQLKKADAKAIAYARGRRHEMIRHRANRYPSKNTCGSFFRNFHEDEVVREINGKKAIWVAYYLDKIGVKGELKVGDAQVSHQHANMIVNGGSARTADIIAVARRMQELVKEAFGIVPRPECRLVGFKEYPLIK